MVVIDHDLQGPLVLLMVVGLQETLLLQNDVSQTSSNQVAGVDLTHFSSAHSSETLL